MLIDGVNGAASPLDARGGDLFVGRSTTNNTLQWTSGGILHTDAATFALRPDSVLPSSDLAVLGSGVFWPTPGQPGADALAATDHRLVFVDVKVPEPASVVLLLVGGAAALGRRGTTKRAGGHSA